MKTSIHRLKHGRRLTKQLSLISSSSSSSSSLYYNNNNNNQCYQYQCIRSFGSPTTGPLGKGYDILGSGNDIDGGPRRTSVNSLGDKSFMINDVLIRQSVILLPTSYLLWNVRTFDEITIESLSLFPLIYPKLEAIFIGGNDDTNSYYYYYHYY